MVESHRIYADGPPELTQITHYKPGSFEAIAQEQHTPTQRSNFQDKFCIYS